MQTPRIMMMGNPGTGKSTLLNGIAQNACFRSGVSTDGAGFMPNMKESQPVNLGGRPFTLCDTPGLMDPSKKQEAIRQINAALKQDRETKLVFVTTLPNGRVVDQDATAIRTILQAINKEHQEEIDDRFAVIVNQLGVNEYKRLLDPSFDGRLEKKMATLLNETAKTKYILCLPEEDSLLEREDAIPAPNFTRQYLDFLLQLPAIFTRKGEVKAITEEKLTSANEEIMAIIQQLKQQNHALMQKLEMAHAERIAYARQNFISPFTCPPPQMMETCYLCGKPFGMAETRVKEPTGRMRHLCQAAPNQGGMFMPFSQCRPNAQYGEPGVL